jgi:signal transduction histidine kinase/ActR/RegA family two-component response regulator
MAGLEDRRQIRIDKSFGVSRALKIAGTLLLMASVAWIYYAYSLLLSPRNVAALVGPQENYYWPVAQLAIAATRTENELTLYGTGRKKDVDNVLLSFRLLESKYALLTRPSDVAAMFTGSEQYQTSLRTVGKILASARSSVDRIDGRREVALAIAEQLQQLREPIGILVDSVGDVEVLHRDSVYNDFLSKRRALFASSLLILILLMTIGATLIAVNARRRGFLRAEQQAANAARQAEKAKNAFIGMIGHELRTPLQSITAGVDVLDAKLSGPDIVSISDPYRIQQIITNLVSNAIKYTDRGRITVSVDCQVGEGVDWMHITVDDTGLGMPTDKLASLFEPFTQLDQGSTRRQDGAGMGLAIVKRLVGAFDGSIDVQSEIGKGTTIKVSLPVWKARVVDVTSRAPPAHGQSNFPKRVLVVDDNEAARESFQLMLTSFGIEADFASNAVDALERLSHWEYGTVLLDLQMPGKDGVAVARALRAGHGPNKHVAIICISAYAAELLDDEQRRLFAHYLMKPVRAETLRNVMEEINRGGEQK